MNFFRLCVVACVACALLGCGQKGPLILPDAPKHKRTAPKPPSTPAPAKPAGDGAATTPAPADAGTATSPAPAGPSPSQSAPPQP